MKEPAMPSSRLQGFIASVVMGAALAIAAPAAAQAPQASIRPKVVLQMSEADPAKWSLALNNAKNIQTDLGAANVDIELVTYGPGTGMLKADSIVGNRVDEAIAAGVKVFACENS